MKGTLQLDMSYTTIPVFGQQRRLYRETLMKYMVSSQEKTHNYHLYSTHSDLDSFILYNDGDTKEPDSQRVEEVASQDECPERGEATKMENVITEDFPADFWSMDFDGAVSKEGVGTGVWLHNHQKRYSENHSYKLNFHCTNNVAEYKDLHSFDSSKVKCIGLIKDLCITLVQIPSKSMVMDVVVADIPPKYGMLLSRSWGAKMKGTLQLDMSYTTIPVFGQ